ncbi:hypothetical protein ACJ2A9_21825 [Anaerobacillus sp. MEB173]
MKNDKQELNPETLKEKFNFKIDDKIATPEEIDVAVKYIRALRIMKEL